MKLINYYTSILTLLLMAEMVMGTCESNRKLDCSLLGDLLEMAMKQKSPDKACQCPSRSKIPAFSAMLTKSQSLGANDAIKFDRVATNIQDGYNPTTGIFTTPVAGVYQFSFTVMSNDGKQLYVYITHNNTKQQGIWLHGSGYKTGSTVSILSLKKGDRVEITTNGSYTTFSSGSWYGSFSGYLIA